MRRTTVTGAALLGFLGVGAGAFGAHALEASLDPPSLEAYRTAVRYQLFHAAVLLALGLYRGSPPLPPRIPWTFLCGVVLFSGSIYGLALVDVRWLGFVTPLGGSLLLLGWAQLVGWGITLRTSNTTK